VAAKYQAIPKYHKQRKYSLSCVTKALVFFSTSSNNLRPKETENLSTEINAKKVHPLRVSFSWEKKREI
jgi:hypothetical protein